MAIRTFQKGSLGQVRDRLILMIVVVLVISSISPLIRVSADDRNRPVRIGVLTDSWGPTPATVGLRDGLTELGYLEDRDYFLGIRLRRILFPYDASSASALREVAIYRRAARQLGIELIEKPVHTPEEARDVLSRMQPGEVDGVLPPSCCSMNIPGFVLDIMPAKRIPALFDSAFWPERGAVASYGQDLYESGRQAARLVDKILKGPATGRDSGGGELEARVRHQSEGGAGDGADDCPGGVVSGRSHHPLMVSQARQGFLLRLFTVRRLNL